MATQQVPATNPSTTSYSMASLYVGDLHPEVTESMLFERFSVAGPVLSIRVCRDNATRLSLGYAYVNFQQPADAERAMDTMNFDTLREKPMRIMWSQRDPAMRRSGTGNIFIKNLDKVIDNKSIYDTFSLFGNILSCKVAIDEEGNSKGYGFVHFETEEAAQSAIQKVNGMLLAGKKVFVGKFQPRAQRLREMGETAKRFTNVFVKNFGDTLDEQKLEKLFSQFGKISSCAVMSSDGKSKGFGFVAFSEPEEAEKAVNAMHDSILEGTEQKLFVCRAQKKSERQALFLRKKRPKLSGLAETSKMADHDVLPECPVCLSPIMDESTIPMVATCGHSLCDGCLKDCVERANNPNCPQCQSTGALRNAVKNYGLIKSIEVLKSCLDNKNVLEQKLAEQTTIAFDYTKKYEESDRRLRKMMEEQSTWLECGSCPLNIKGKKERLPMDHFYVCTHGKCDIAGPIGMENDQYPKIMMEKSFCSRCALKHSTHNNDLAPAFQHVISTAAHRHAKMFSNKLQHEFLDKKTVELKSQITIILTDEGFVKALTSVSSFDEFDERVRDINDAIKGVSQINETFIQSMAENEKFVKGLLDQL